MTEYAIRRILLVIPTLLVGSILLFLVLRLLPPEDAIEIRIDPELRLEDPEIVDVQRRQAGIYGPLHEQYLRWIGGFLTGDFGKSLVSKRPITDELQNRIPVSLELSFIGLIFTWGISFPLGVWAAIRQDKYPDYFLRTAAYALDALPSFVLGIFLLTYLAVSFNWAPPVNFVYLWEDPVTHLRMMILPTIIVGLASTGNLIRLTRTFFLEVMRQDYIRTARSKGLSERTVLFRHALRNVAIPFITIVGTSIPLLLTSSAIIESLFSLPGMGRYLVEASGNLDYPVVMTTTMMFAIIVIVTQLLTDLSYAVADPRVTYRRDGS